jgi:cyclopropane-fatty-acyl-phospholipid synthase
MWIYKLLETDCLPEWLIRFGIRRMLDQKLREETQATQVKRQEALMRFIQELQNSPIAIETKAANEQHYEVPSEFFALALGPRKKYSSAYWMPDTQTLAEAEELMLSLVCQRAEIEDGQRILDLGCGWGSLSLWLAERYPNAQVTGLSNSRTQKDWIDAEAKRLNLVNLTIITGNIVDWDFSPEMLPFDRIVSIEMFEHMKNYGLLLAKISRWLAPATGKLLVHIFTHKTLAYHYEDKDGTDWLTRHFFSGGTMPSNDLLLYFQDDLRITNQWVVSGQHYEKTANEWLANMHRNRHAILPILSETYGAENCRKWWVYWKVFFLACAELWGYHEGEEWQVSHYLFARQ